MKQSAPTNPSFTTAVILLLVIIFVSLSLIIIFQTDPPEKLLLQSKVWKDISRSTTTSLWNPSDGSTAKHVSDQTISNGFEISLQPTKSSTREAFYNDGVIIKDVFKLTVEVNTPTDCNNGLVFRGNELGEYYLFLISSCANTYTVEILQRESNEDLPREALILNTTIPESIGKPHKMTVIGKEGNYYFYINNVFVNQINDTRLYGNHVGVEVLKCNETKENIVFKFENFTLESP